MFAIGLGFVGYALFYWGLHHFPGFQHYSLFTLLGGGTWIDKKHQIPTIPSNAQPIQLGGNGLKGGPRG